MCLTRHQKWQLQNLQMLLALEQTDKNNNFNRKRLCSKREELAQPTAKAVYSSQESLAFCMVIL